MMKQSKVIVYYDGLCKLCSKEINHYRQQEGADQLDFVDICSPGFDAIKEGLDPFLVHQVMHVRRLDGSFATRVDAFIEIWKTLPRYKFLAQIASKSLIKAGLEFGYTGFAKIRQILPRHKNSNECKDSPYCQLPN